MTNEPTTEIPAANITHKNRRMPIILTMLMAASLLLLSLLPLAIRTGITSWLNDHGVQQVEIDNVDLNLFAGTFAIEGFTADEGLRVGRLAVNIDWWPMLEHRISIRSVELKNITADVHQNKNEIWQVSTIRTDEHIHENPQKKQDEESGEPWQVVLNDIDITDVNLKVVGKLDQKPFDFSLLLNSLNVSLLKTEPDGGQTLKNKLKLGKVTFNGLGYTVRSASLQLDNRVFLPAIGVNIADKLQIDDMNITLDELSLFDNSHNMQLAVIDAIQLNQARAVGVKRATFNLLSLQGITLPTAGDDSMGSINKVGLHGADLDFSGIYKLQKVTVHNFKASIKKMKNGKILLLNNLQAQASSEPFTTPVKSGGKSGGKSPATSGRTTLPKTDKKPMVYITDFLVSKGSTIVYSDATLSPPFQTKIAIEKLTFSPIDLSGKENANLDAKFILNKNGSLAIQGNISPNVDVISADLKVILKNFDMLPLTAFVESDYGQSIKTGQLELTSDIKIANNKIDAKNKLLIRKLALEKSSKSGKASKSIGMPVNMALDMLRDTRGDISMDVPISGRLNDPNISLGNVINKALTSAMSTGALTFAKLALQPYGGMIMAAELATGIIKEAAKPKLTPIRFNERSATLNPDMRDYTIKIASLMKQKNFRLQICGVSTRIEGGGADQGTPQIMNDERLLVLAEARSNVVLKAIQDQGIAADRLFNCRSTIDELSKQVAPRVELILD